MSTETIIEQKKDKVSGFSVRVVIFPLLSLLALLFVFWIGFASFEKNCNEINRHLYMIITDQSVSDLESAIRNGKNIESFYGIDSLLTRTAGYIRHNAHVAVTSPHGRLLYGTFDIEEGFYSGLLRSEQVRHHMQRDPGDRGSTVVTADGYELLIQPIFGRDGTQAGNLCVMYPARDTELLAEQSRWMLIMTLYVAGSIMVAVIIWLCIRKRVGAALDKRVFDAVPAILLTIGILIQSILSFFTYQTQYKEMMLKSAHTTCLYMESLISQARDKGIPYDKMYGLDEFFADKLRQMPGLWDIKLVRVLADSQDVLTRDSEFLIAVPISGDEHINMQLNVSISQQYIDRKMAETMLLSFISLVICVVAVVEIIRLPEIITLRAGKDFAKPVPRQWEGVKNGLRLCSFLMYTSVYLVIPFSSMLVRQWRQTMFDFSLDVTAGIPMTVEIFSLMIGSLLCAAIFKRVKLKGALGASIITFVAANLLCLTVMSPYWLAVLRFICGLGFSGILHTSNFIVSYGTQDSAGRSSGLAGINAGLLGGIMVGGSLGAVIASTMGVALCFVAAACICAVAGIIYFTLMPWKLLITRYSESRTKATAQEDGAESAITGAKAVSKKQVTSPESIGFLKTLGLFARPRLLLYFLLVMAPLSFGLMFIVACMPALAQAEGLSPLLLSCGFLANGVAGIYLGGPLLKRLGAKLRGDTLVASVVILGGIAVGAVFLPPLWLTLLLCAFLLGIFDGVGSPSVMGRFLELPGISKMRPVDSLAVGNTIMRAVNTLAPVLYGVLIAAAAGGAGTFAILGLVFAAAGIVHLFVSITTKALTIEDISF